MNPEIIRLQSLLLHFEAIGEESWLMVQMLRKKLQEIIDEEQRQTIG